MGLDEHGLGYVFFGWGILLAITSVFVAPKLQARFNLAGSMGVMLTLFALDLVFMGLGAATGSPTLVIIGVIVAGIFLGINNTLITTAVMESAPVERSVARQRTALFVSSVVRCRRSSPVNWQNGTTRQLRFTLAVRWCW